MRWILCLMLIGCGHKNKVIPTGISTAAITSKQKLYCDLSRPAYEERRWVHSKCDGLLFTSLRGFSCDDVKIEEFESATDPGLWYRDPKHSCSIDTNPISNDMILGLMLYSVKTKKTELLQRLEKKTKASSWSLGKCDDAHIGNCAMWITLTSVLYDYFKTQGVSLVDPNSGDQIPLVTGYRAHLVVLHVLLDAVIHGGASGLEVALLKSQADRQPRNALYQAAYHRYSDGDQSAANALIMDTARYPADKLPNNHDNFCTEYAYQRDDTPGDWDSCPNEVYSEHSGTDLTMAAALITGVL